MQGLFFLHIRALPHIRASLTTEASKTIAAAIVGPRLDFCNSLLAGTSVSNLSRILVLEWSHKNLGSATSRLSFLICIGFRFATELYHQNCYGYFQSAPISAVILSCISHLKICTGASTLLFVVFVNIRSSMHIKPPWQPPNHFHLFLQISGMHCQIIYRPFQLFLLL